MTEAKTQPSNKIFAGKGFEDTAIQQDTLTEGVQGVGFIWDTGVYDVTIKIAQFNKYASGSCSLVLVVGAEGKDDCTLNKIGLKNINGSASLTYPKFNTLHKIVAGVAGSECTMSQKQVKLFNKDEDITSIDSLVGKQCKMLITKNIEVKQTASGSQYIDTGLSRNVNEMSQALFPDGRSFAEASTNSSAIFMTEWKNKFEGKEFDKTPDKRGLVFSPSAGKAQGKANATASGAPAPAVGESIDDLFV